MNEEYIKYLAEKLEDLNIETSKSINLTTLIGYDESREDYILRKCKKLSNKELMDLDVLLKNKINND
jgi:hypothetical protein